MRTYKHTPFAVLDRYDILYGGHKSDAGVGSGCRRRFLDDFASPQRLKSVGKRIARLRCVFGSTDGYGVQKNWVSSSYVRLS
jgi:hypothetical protein